MNESQTRAVKVALGRTLTLWQGPPGTGKTTTLIRSGDASSTMRQTSICRARRRFAVCVDLGWSLCSHLVHPGCVLTYCTSSHFLTPGSFRLRSRACLLEPSCLQRLRQTWPLTTWRVAKMLLPHTCRRPHMPSVASHHKYLTAPLPLNVHDSHSSSSQRRSPGCSAWGLTWCGWGSRPRCVRAGCTWHKRCEAQAPRCQPNRPLLCISCLRLQVAPELRAVTLEARMSATAAGQV